MPLVGRNALPLEQGLRTVREAGQGTAEYVRAVFPTVDFDWYKAPPRFVFGAEIAGAAGQRGIIAIAVPEGVRVPFARVISAAAGDHFNTHFAFQGGNLVTAFLQLASLPAASTQVVRLPTDEQESQVQAFNGTISNADQVTLLTVIAVHQITMPSEQDYTPYEYEDIVGPVVVGATVEEPNTAYRARMQWTEVPTR